MTWFKVTINATPPIEVQTPEPAPEKLLRIYMIQANTFLEGIERGLRVYASEVKLEPSELSIHTAEESVVPLVQLNERVPVSPSPKVVTMLDGRGKKEE